MPLNTISIAAVFTVHLCTAQITPVYKALWKASVFEVNNKTPSFLSVSYRASIFTFQCSLFLRQQQTKKPQQQHIAIQSLQKLPFKYS